MAVNKSKPRVETSCKHAPVSLVTGMVILTLGIGMMLSCILQNRPFFDDLRLGLTGLCGLMSYSFIPLIIYMGILFLAQGYHTVSWRGFLCLAGLWLFTSAAITLLSYNQLLVPPGLGQSNLSGFSYVMNNASSHGHKGQGTGLLGVLPAYTIHALIGDIPGSIVCIIADIVLIFVLLRTNPLRVFNAVSDSMEGLRQKRYEKQLQREKEQEQQTAEKMNRYITTARSSIPQSQPLYRNPIKTAAANAYSMHAKADVYNKTESVSFQDTPIPEDYDEGFYPDSANQQSFFDVQPTDVPVQSNAIPTVREQETVNKKQATEKDLPPVGNISVSQTQPKDASAGIVSHGSRKRENTGTPANTAAAPSLKDAFFDDAVFDVPETDIQAYDMPQEYPEYDENPKEYPDNDALPEPGTNKLTRTRTVPVKKPVSDVPMHTESPAPEQNESKESNSSSHHEDDEDTDDTLSWAELVRQQKEKLKTSRLASSDKPKEVNTDPAVRITGEHIAIPVRDTFKTGDPDKRGIDGHEHQTVNPVQVSMNIPMEYTPPPVSLLSLPSVKAQNTADEDNERARRIVDTLESFRISSEIKQIMHGPAITRFAIQIGQGIKVSSVIGVQDNIGLQLGTKQVRVEAPIQGTNYIGIEAPNARVTPVTLREVLESDEMRGTSNPLTVALGKDIAGTPILCDLSKMPHLLIAGATGSGKSVCINSIVCSLIYRASPAQVRLIMVDPKQVELQTYNGIPHLLVPVVSEPKKAAAVLNWVVNEMFERYHKFSEAKTRNIAGYNKLKAGTEETLPNIVVIIDEMADLMDVCRKDVEESIRRLAALARAAGIYMVLATQRPSVDVITGVIKNNIPSRIAFAVSSAIDSRTILDIGGAEKLVGKGDMLYKPTGQSPVRVQGCFLSDDEVNAITENVSSRYETNYNPDIQEEMDNARESDNADNSESSEEPGASGEGASFDDLLQEAIQMAIEDGQASTSMLQRRLRIGYARAGRLIDEMEKREIISKSEGSKPRKTIMTREEYMRMCREAEGSDT